MEHNARNVNWNTCWKEMIKSKCCYLLCHHFQSTFCMVQLCAECQNNELWTEHINIFCLRMMISDMLVRGDAKITNHSTNHVPLLTPPPRTRTRILYSLIYLHSFELRRFHSLTLGSVFIRHGTQQHSWFAQFRLAMYRAPAPISGAAEEGTEDKMW